MRRICIQSISSDIGCRLAEFWKSHGNIVTGTYRTFSSNVQSVIDHGIEVEQCDLSEKFSIDSTAQWVLNQPNWDIFVFAAGNLEPISPFISTDIDKWESSIYQNFVGQFRLLQQVLPARNLSGMNPPMVLMFAGGGTNSAPTRYSAYTVSKIACIKMCEILDAEIQDTVFTILGPGWVDTKIHSATLRAGVESAGKNYLRTIEVIESSNWTAIEDVVECCDWLINARREIIAGRNIDAVSDPWNSDAINEIESDPDMFRLRRFGNTAFRGSV